MKGAFYLNKWYLDYIDPSGEMMIFYAAELHWHTWKIRYTSRIHQSPGQATQEKSRFRNVTMPEFHNQYISWSDPYFEVEGIWKSLADPIQTRLFETPDGYMDWNCYQTKSDVQLVFQGRKLHGTGYVEQLQATIPPWQLPMSELRWGRFGSNHHHLVWIAWQHEQSRLWVWMDNDPVQVAHITDDLIELPHNKMNLQLTKIATIESEKKIASVISKISRFIPGIKKWIPLHYLTADEHKWISRGQLFHDNKLIEEGMAIHEYVDFRNDHA